MSLALDTTGREWPGPGRGSGPLLLRDWNSEGRYRYRRRESVKN